MSFDLEWAVGRRRRGSTRHGLKVLLTTALVLALAGRVRSTANPEDVQQDPAYIEGTKEWWKRRKDEASAKVGCVCVCVCAYVCLFVWMHVYVYVYVYVS